MGDDLYAEVIPRDRLDVPCRVYAPVGSHEDLLPYLVRRLLENGANPASSTASPTRTSPSTTSSAIRSRPSPRSTSIPHPRIPLPVDLYRSQAHQDFECTQAGSNSMGINLANDDAAAGARRAGQRRASPTGAPRRWCRARRSPARPSPVTNPADRRQHVGQWQAADAATVELALKNAVAAQPAWDRTPAARARRSSSTPPTCSNSACREYIALCTREAGKTIPDGVAEVREAVDFLRYYAGEARKLFAPEALPGPTGESNTLQLHGRGVFVCISPWNFPLAIFAGQIAAALAAGNSVIAKPAEQTNLIGYARGEAAARSRRAGSGAAVPAGRRRHRRRRADRAIRAWPASPSPVPPTPRARSTARWPRAMPRSAC